MRRHLSILIASVFVIVVHSSPVLAAAIGNNAGQQETNATGMAVMPQRGLTMREVERYYGQPQKKDAPVGKPPISRWHYDGFIVVFDRNYVIHSIASAD